MSTSVKFFCLSPIFPLPKSASPESIGTTFKLYTNANRPESVKETGQYLDYDNATSLLMSHFNASNDVKIIIHGFGSSSRRPWVLNITKALLDLVIYLDYFGLQKAKIM